MTREGTGRLALITGASAGIGHAFATHLAGRGYDLLLAARRADRLEALARTLAGQDGIRAHVRVVDLSARDAGARLADEVRASGLHVDVLVNNAGYGVPGRFGHPAWDTHAAFLQVMVTAVCELTYHLLPGMYARGWGRIINVASLAGLLPAPAGHTLYAASKAFLVRFSEALHAESAGRGVHVTAVCPGFTFSEFHDVTGTRARVSRLPRWLWMEAPAVAAEGYAAVMRGEPVWVIGGANRMIARLGRLLPPPLVRRAVGASGGRFRDTD